MTSNEDKKQAFMFYYRMFTPQDAPRPVSEYPFSKVIGRKHRFDWAWPKYRIAVEIDGGNHLVKYSKKTGKAVAVGYHAQDSDYEKLNLAASLRWLVFRFTPKMLKNDPETCVGLVWQALKDSK